MAIKRLMTLDQLIQRYTGGRGLLDLSLESGLTVDKIRSMLLASGVEIRRRGGPKGVSNTAHKFRNPICRACRPAGRGREDTPE